MSVGSKSGVKKILNFNIVLMFVGLQFVCLNFLIFKGWEQSSKKSSSVFLIISIGLKEVFKEVFKKSN